MPPKEVPVAKPGNTTIVAPTPQNTPLVKAPISQARPDIPDTINEGDGDINAESLNRALEDADVDGDSDLEELPLAVRRRVEGLKGVHVEYMKLEQQYKRELLELDRKYAALYAPIFERRKTIIIGAAEPTEQEIKEGEEWTLKEDPDAEPLPAEDEDSAKGPDGEPVPKGVPSFWLRCLQTHGTISELITERDEACLESLTDIRLEYLPSSTPGYKISFHFAPNDYFTNDVLTKTYHYQDEVDYVGDYVYSSAEGCKIDWKEDMDLTKIIEQRKQRNKNTNRTRIVKRATSTPSFFDFFNPPKPPSPELMETHEFTEEEMEKLEEALELDYQIGEDLKDKVIPRAIDYFTGKALEWDLDLDEEDDEEEAEWDEDDDEGSDGSEDHGPPLRARKQVTKDNTKTDPGECKNQ